MDRQGSVVKVFADTTVIRVQYRDKAVCEVNRISGAGRCQNDLTVRHERFNECRADES
jgi:hypothetical protein